MSEFLKNTGKLASGVVQTAWWILWLGLASFSAGMVCRLCSKAFRTGWGML